MLLILASRCCTAANRWGVPRPPKWNDIEDLMNNNCVVNKDAKEDEGRWWRQIYCKILCQPGKLLKDFKKIIQQVITSIKKQMKGKVSQLVRQWQKEQFHVPNQHWKILKTTHDITSKPALKDCSNIHNFCKEVFLSRHAYSKKMVRRTTFWLNHWLIQGKNWL